ncbi:MAG: hypothetical protein JW893_01795 [Candidatus Omnitrophica bacterium]|nr:hypothetical protein [Candidatus Omnitrophota bacterium]
MKFRHVALLGLCVLIFLAYPGCSYEWQKKFIRQKKKDTKKSPRFEVDSTQRPYPELYKEHYHFWHNWHRQLILDLGTNRQREERDLKEARRQLEALALYLQEEKAETVRQLVEEFDRVSEPAKEGSIGTPNYGLLKRHLESLQTKIEKNLRYKRVKDYFLPTPIPIDLDKYAGEEPDVGLPAEDVKPETAEADSDKGDHEDQGVISYEEYRTISAQ